MRLPTRVRLRRSSEPTRNGRPLQSSFPFLVLSSVAHDDALPREHTVSSSNSSVLGRKPTKCQPRLTDRLPLDSGRPYYRNAQRSAWSAYLAIAATQQWYFGWRYVTYRPNSGLPVAIRVTL